MHSLGDLRGIRPDHQVCLRCTSCRIQGMWVMAQQRWLCIPRVWGQQHTLGCSNLLTVAPQGLLSCWGSSECKVLLPQALYLMSSYQRGQCRSGIAGFMQEESSIYLCDREQCKRTYWRPRTWSNVSPSGKMLPRALAGSVQFCIRLCLKHCLAHYQFCC